MLEGEEELVVSDEDFSMTSETEEDTTPELSLAQLILKNAHIQQEIQAKLDLQKLEKSVPDRITKLPSHSHLKRALTSLWKDHSRLLTLSHVLHECDCSGNQEVESTLINNFNDRRASYEANEAKLKLKAEQAKAKAEARKNKQRNSDDSDFDSDATGSEVDSDATQSNEEDDGDEEASNASGLTARTEHTELQSVTDSTAEQGEQGEEGEEHHHRDSDDDIEPPPDIPAITLAFVNNIIRNKKKLEGLQMDENPLGTNGTIALCQTLMTVPNLTMLNLSAVNAGPDGAQALGDALRSSNLQRTLLHLVFGYNSIGSEGATSIVEAVGRRCRSLETLRLHNNMITSDGAKAVARELLQSKALQVLDLGGNEIGDRGIEMIADYVGENSSLKRLNLQDNSFTMRGGHALVHMLHVVRQFPPGERIQRLSVARCRRLKEGTKKELKDAASHLDGFFLTV